MAWMLPWKKKELQPVHSSGGWFGLIRESFAGAWQSNVEVDAPRSILSSSAVFACVTGIASDIGKMRFRLMQEDPSTYIWSEVRDQRVPFLRVIRTPNHFLNRIKFIEQWVLSKLLHGNAYILKERDARGIVVALYVLDAQLVTPLVAESGEVFYELKADKLSGVTALDRVIVPAAEIIHDRMCCLWHPLVGISPIYACGVSATMANKIQANSTNFFANQSRPSGMLTAPGEIKQSTADRLKAAWEANFGGTKIGRLAVLGDGLKYEAMTIPAHDAQLIEQLKWTVEDIARAFHYPLYKLGGPPPTYNGVESVTQAYYSDCLQALIESIELCLDEGLALPMEYGVEFDLSGLMRMDTLSRTDMLNKAVAGGWLAPNEARAEMNRKPVRGGESPMMQQQNWSLAQLAERKAPADSPAVAAPPAAPSASPPPNSGSSNEPAPEDEEQQQEEEARLAALLAKDFTEALSNERRALYG